ncbi:hypothetical protein [Kordia zhangzhouensis]|uniref:hypothetical protein n=1 Tax=Kordia zhangzhouensis TaxID=1620405 RepID=UPI0006297E77|nr:hypothetical protein [Kordia zhangzhouensis]
MKKKSLKSLSVKKSTISNLNKDEILAGLAIRTYYTICGTGPLTIYGCPTNGLDCTYNSRERCKTNEVDGNTLPIC